MEKIQPTNWQKRKKKCQNPFQAILRLKTLKKNVAWTTKPLGEGGKTLVVRPLKKKNYVCLPKPMLRILGVISFKAKR